MNFLIIKIKYIYIVMSIQEMAQGQRGNEKKRSKMAMAFVYHGASAVWSDFSTIDLDSVKIPAVGYFLFFTIGYAPWLVLFSFYFHFIFILFFIFSFSFSIYIKSNLIPLC